MMWNECPVTSLNDCYFLLTSANSKKCERSRSNKWVQEMNKPQNWEESRILYSCSDRKLLSWFAWYWEASPCCTSLGLAGEQLGPCLRSISSRAPGTRINCWDTSSVRYRHRLYSNTHTHTHTPSVSTGLQSIIDCWQLLLIPPPRCPLCESSCSHEYCS